MKRSLTLATLLLSLITLTPTVTGQKRTCSCKAPDRKCNVSVTCSRGCTAICGSNDGCLAKCGKQLIKTRFTLKLVDKGAKTIASALSRRTGRTIKFVPRTAGDLFSIDTKTDDLWTAMDYLDERGKLYIDDVPWENYQEIRRRMKDGKLRSVTFDNISVREALAHLSFLSGLRLVVKSGNAAKLLSLVDLQDLTLDEIIARISAQTGVEIEQRSTLIRRTKDQELVVSWL